MPMPQLTRAEKIDLLRKYLDQEGLDREPMHHGLDRLFDDPKVRERVGEVIAAALLGGRVN